MLTYERRKGNVRKEKEKKDLVIFHGGDFTDVQSSHASYRLSLLVNLLTRTVLSLPFPVPSKRRKWRF